MAPKRAAAPAAENYDSWSVPQLKAKLSELGGSVSGGKAQLVERVKALTEAAAEAAAPKAAAKRGAAKAKAAPAAVEQPAPKRGAAKAKAKAEPVAEPAPKRGSAAAKAKAKAEAAEAPKRSAPAAKAAPEDTPATKKRKADAPKGEKDFIASTLEKSEATPMDEGESVNISGPSTIHYEDGDFSAEYAKSNRSTCKKCKEKIEKGVLRIGKSVPSDKFDGNITNWFHWDCLVASGALPRYTQMIQGFSTLRPEDQDMISKKIPPSADAAGGGAENPELKAQNKKVFEVLDALNMLSDNQLKEMLEVNDYPSQKLGDKCATKAQLCADGIMFGACEKCEVCSGGHLLLSGDGYRCRGWVNDYLKCTFKTQKPGRVEWTLTQAAKTVAGGKLGKMKLKTGDRLFAAEMRDDEEIAASQEASQKKPLFLGMTVVVLEKGDTLEKEKLEQMIKSNGGSVADGVSKVAECVVTRSDIVPEEDDDDESAEPHPEVAKAKQLGIVGVNEDFIKDSVETGELQDMAEYLLWGEVKKRRIQEAQTSSFIEKMGVSMDADVGELAQTAHVLVDRQKKQVYSEMLTRTDLVTGSNSFYTLHLLESDKVSDGKYWVFRKWGRIGVSQGGTKLEEFGSKSSAVHAFNKQYEDKTGNRFGEPFAVKTGKFVRVDMEHKALSKKAQGDAGSSSVATKQEGGDQPLGKLSKAQIEKGDAVLDQIEKVIGEGDFTSADPVKKAQAVAQFTSLSAEFYTLIPHNFGAKKPPTINNSELLGAEKALLQFYLRMGFEEIAGDDDEKLTPIGGVMELPLPETLKQAASKVCGDKDIKSCVSKGTTMHKKKAGKPMKIMTPDLYGAILLYTSNAIYKQLNKALRDEDRTTVESYFPYLRMLFEACARLPQQKRTLWRGVGVDLFEQYKVGSTIVWWGVSSCTSDEKVARNFMAGCGDGATLLTVEVVSACDIAEVSFYANEAESILLPGTQLEVVSSKKTGKKSEIALREVGRVVN